MDREELMEILKTAKALLVVGFEQALIGFVEQPSGGVVALYDRPKCIQILMTREGMAEEEADEFFEFNVLGSYMGEDTPNYATLITG